MWVVDTTSCSFLVSASLMVICIFSAFASTRITKQRVLLCRCQKMRMESKWVQCEHYNTVLCAVYWYWNAQFQLVYLHSSFFLTRLPMLRILTSYVVKTALEVLEGGEQNDQLFSELLSNLGELVRLLLLVPDNSVPYIMSTDISFVYPTIQRRGLRLPSILLPRSKCIHQGWVFCPQSNNIACIQSCQTVKHTDL